MSRSWKKTPSYTGSPGAYRRFAKREANAIVRRTKGVLDGAWYRRLYPLRWFCYDDTMIYHGGRREVMRRQEESLARDAFWGWDEWRRYPLRPWKAWTK